MTKPTPEGGNSIDRLLHDRAQFVSWLTRLNSTADQSLNIPEAVRGRVRADYERRLSGVLDELRGHTTALEDQVDSLAGRAAELTTREAEHKERLAEAEVRHQVGEYDEVKWDGIRAELLKVIGHIREELGQTMHEVGRLNEVLGLIRAPVAPAPITASAPRPAISTSGQRAAVTTHEHAEPPRQPPASPPAAPASAEIPFRPPTPRPQPKPAAPPPATKKDDAGRTLWFPSGKPEPSGAGGKLDELAFLKSVTGNETPAAPPPTQRTRSSGGFRSVEVPAPAPSPTPPPPPPPQAPPPQAAAPLLLPDPLPGPKAPPVERERTGGSGQKTLKCGECGTLNRPTEWYCERCGAELAAL